MQHQLIKKKNKATHYIIILWSPSYLRPQKAFKKDCQGKQQRPTHGMYTVYEFHLQGNE